MQAIKLFVLMCLISILSACSKPPPDYTGQWEQINGNETIKHFLTITYNGEHYRIVDELRNIQSDEITYDETSNGALDGQKLLAGTNNLTNVLSLNEETQELFMQTPDETTLIFKKIP